MVDVTPEAAREFAVSVVRTLRTSGFDALWAGGCVRDLLLQRTPKDYDVATSATPDQVRSVFGVRNTLAVGASFGVMIVRGRREQGQIDVATFRRDAEYSDGRHPDHVTFSSPEEDAQRRDFTINGLFYDPLAEQVVDFVGGVDDLMRGVVRAIGRPHDRFAEDKLRMLRAIRFAATFEFALDDATFAAIREQVDSLVVVSAERIAAELRRMLVHRTRVRAVELLRSSGLLRVILPESVAFDGIDESDSLAWRTTREVLARLTEPSFGAALAGLIRDLCHADAAAVEKIGRRWKLSNDEIDSARFALTHESLVRQATRTPWSRVQRVLVAPRVADLLTVAAAVAEVFDGGAGEIDFCRERLAQPREVFDPPPLLTGNDLKAAGLPPGPNFRRWLEALRDAQLDGRVTTREEAIRWAQSLIGVPVSGTALAAGADREPAASAVPATDG